MSRRRDRKQTSRAGGRRRLWPLAAFLGVVFTVKLAVLAQIQDHPLIQPEGGVDAVAYVRLAREVLGGNVTLGPGLYYLSPLYIYVLAAGLGLTESFTAIRAFQAALGTMAVGGVYVAAQAWFGWRAAWMAATLAALTGVFTFYELVILQSSLDTFLTAAALACLAWGLRPAAPATAFRTIGAGGLFFGLQILNRPNVAIAVAGLALGLLVIRRGRAAAAFAAGVLVALGPVVARNAIVSHQFALAGSQGGLNLYLGNRDGATGQYLEVPGVRANISGQAEDTKRVAEQAAGRSLTDSEVSAYFAGLATTWMREHPAAAAKLFLKKLALAFNARHQWLDFSYPYYAYDTGSLLRFLIVGPWLLVPLGFAGLARASTRGEKTAGVALSFVPLYAISIAIFFVAERYRLPLLVALCIYSGGALDGLLRAFRSPASDLHPPAPAAARLGVVAMLIAGTILAALPFDLPDGRFEERLRLAKVLMNRSDYGAAAIELEEAHLLRPSDTTAEFNLGMALISSGRADEGLRHVKHAVDAGVPMPGARYALASAVLATGDREGAISLLRSYYPEPSDSAESCFRVGLLALDAGAPRVAERYLQRALQLRPGWPEALDAISRIPR